MRPVLHVQDAGPPESCVGGVFTGDSALFGAALTRVGVTVSVQSAGYVELFLSRTLPRVCSVCLDQKFVVKSLRRSRPTLAAPPKLPSMQLSLKLSAPTKRPGLNDRERARTRRLELSL